MSGLAVLCLSIIAVLAGQDAPSKAKADLADSQRKSAGTAKCTATEVDETEEHVPPEKRYGQRKKPGALVSLLGK